MDEDILDTAAKDEAAAQKKEDRYRATRVLAQAHFQQQDGNGLQQVHPHSTGCKWTDFFSNRLPGFGMSTLCSCPYRYRPFSHSSLKVTCVSVLWRRFGWWLHCSWAWLLMRSSCSCLERAGDTHDACTSDMAHVELSLVPQCHLEGSLNKICLWGVVSLWGVVQGAQQSKAVVRLWHLQHRPH